MYKCSACGWEGEEDEVFIHAGSLWDYDNYEICPECWEESETISLVYEVYDEEL